ncbi:MAG TPA: hypothetical protein VG223_05970 [Solirubrobacteraceae bacterium]|jgi:hypothetical protein|nr:hypothetical protein [Solirubrobacteraceae bacterium]
MIYHSVHGQIRAALARWVINTMLRIATTAGLIESQKLLGSLT